MSKKFIITWDQMHTLCRELAEKQMPAKQWKGIWAVSRGGLVPGAIIARELGIRHVDTICISSYDHDHQRDMTVVKAPEGDGEGFLIVEDLVDSGETARKLRQMYPKAKLIAVCAKPAGVELLDDYIVDIAQDTWIEQPWDMTLQYIEPINRKQK